MSKSTVAIYMIFGLIWMSMAMLGSSRVEAGYTGSGYVCVSGTERLRVYSRQSRKSRVVGAFSSRDCGMNIEAVEGNWTYVRGSSNGRNIQGWVMNRYLQASSTSDHDNEENNVASAKSCRAFPGAKSVNSRIPVTIRIVNRSDAPRTIMWIDYKGTPVRYADLNPGQSYQQKTYVGHPWMATDGPGNCKEMFHPTKASTYWEIYFSQ